MRLVYEIGFVLHNKFPNIMTVYVTYSIFLYLSLRIPFLSEITCLNIESTEQQFSSTFNDQFAVVSLMFLKARFAYDIN